MRKGHATTATLCAQHLFAVNPAALYCYSCCCSAVANKASTSAAMVVCRCCLLPGDLQLTTESGVKYAKHIKIHGNTMVW